MQWMWIGNEISNYIILMNKITTLMDVLYWTLFQYLLIRIKKEPLYENSNQTSKLIYKQHK